MRSRLQTVAVILVALLTLGTFAFAQSATTSLRGTITDAKGAVVSGATVTLNNEATGFSRTVKSDDQGVYQFLEVPPATYNMSVTSGGFATIKRDNVVLQVSSPATLNINLQVQGTSEIVDVSGEAPMVNTTDATLGNNFNGRQLTDLPSEGRDPVSILSLQPGVVYVGNTVDQTSDSRGGAVNGARSDQTNVTLDGLDDNDQLNGFAFTGAMRATLDSLQEFRVTTSNYDAASGRSSGAQVNLVTKSGTNQFHGSVYEYHRPTIGVANDWFNKQAELRNGLPNVPQHILRNTFGGTIGGPIKKDRLFFFAAYEGQRTADQTQVSRIVPSASLRAGQLKYLCDPSSDTNCKDGSANANFSVASSSTYAPLLVATLTPTGVANLDQGCGAAGTCPWGPGPNPNILSMWSTPTLPLPNGTSGGGDGLNSGSFTFAGNDPVKHDTYIVKLDYKITPNGNHSLFVRGNLQNDHESQPPQFPGLPANHFLTNNSKGIAGGYTALLSNTLINNFRYAFIRQGVGDSGLNDQPFNRLRGLSDVVGLTPIVVYNVPVHNFIDDVSWTKGHHTLQFGTNWRLIRNNRQSNAQNLSEGYENLYWMNPSFIAGEGTSLDPANPTGIASGYPVVDGSFGTSYSFAAMQQMGIMSQVYSESNQDKNGNLIPSGSLVPRHFRNFEGEMYVQDKWNVTPNLTVTAGLRYSLLQPPYEANGNQVAPTVNMHQWFTNRWKGMLTGAVNQPLLTFDTSGQGNGKKPYWAWDYRNFAPRFAIAYSPHAASGFLHTLFGDAGKTSIRAGYGLYFDHFGEGVVNTFDKNGSWGLTTTISNPAGVNTVDSSPRFQGLHVLPPSPGVPLPHGFPYTPSTDPNTYGLAITWGIDDNLKTPYSHVVDFSLTRDLGHNFVVEATYTGRFARHLLQEIDLSQPLDLVDPASKTSYFAAAQQLDKLAYAGTPASSVQPIPYWENLFPAAAGPGLLSGDLTGTVPCSGGTAPANPTATQNIYDMYNCYAGNETLSLEILDAFCFPACAGPNGDQAFSYYQPQFSSLYGWQTRGNSSYNGLQLTLRHAMSSGLQFDFNYTFSKSIDVGSNAERVNGFDSPGAAAYNSQVINAFQPNLWRAVSDFDTTHQLNANFIYDLPFGHARHWGGASNAIANAIFGGWSVSGLFRWTSGFPFSVLAGNGWATDFELEGTSFLQGPKPKTGVFRDQDGDPNVFKNAIDLTCTCYPGDGFNTTFRATYAGEAGQRNNFRGPGFFGIDGGLAKMWNLKENKTLRFSWEVFNVTNSVRFDAAGSLPNEDLVDITSFGKFNAELTNPRVMQFALRFLF